MSIQGRKIGSNSKSSKANQEDNADKVRVMRERQSQWMRQREEEKASASRTPKSSKSTTSVDSLGSRGRTSSTSLNQKSSTSDFEYETGTREAVSNPRRKPLYEPPKRDHSKIISWSGAGDNTGKARRPPSAKSQHQRTASSKSTKLDSSRSNKSDTGKGKPYEPLNYGNAVKPSTEVMASARALYNRLEPVSKMEDHQSERETGEKEGTDIDQGDDDVLRNSLPKSVNMDQVLGVDKPTARFNPMTQDLNPDVINALAETVAKRLKTTLHSDRKPSGATHSNHQQNEDDMSTHLCPLCRTLMLGVRYTPVALIPCGHTFCQVCVRDCRKCPTCQARVKSTAVNTVMQQIIEDVKAQTEKERLQQLEEQTRKYIDEYQSLSLRSNALADEAEAILNNMEETTENIFQEKKIVKKLQVDEEELKQRISELQNQLAKNKTKFTDSQERCNNLEFQYEEEKQRLSLVEDTIKTITQSKERVKMMVHNFAPNLNLDNFD